MRGLGIVAAVVLVVALMSASVIVHFATQETVTFRVDHRERVISRDSEGRTSARYMVWGETEQGIEVFENTDSLLALKWNSADLYGAMAVGAVCEATVTGFRVPLLSWNRNILSANCVRQEG
jgi:hypothetical protein